MKKQEMHALAILGLTAAGVLAWVATKSAGPVQMTQYTEQRQGPLQEHLVTEAELLTQPVPSRMHYPSRVAWGSSALIWHGFAPLYQSPDPQIAAMPSEAAW